MQIIYYLNIYILITLMYRSQEIIQLFSQIYLPKDLTKYILNIERNLLYKKSIHQWIRISKLFHKTQKQKFFYEEIKNTFLNEIKEINGNMIYLKKISRNDLRLFHIFGCVFCLLSACYGTASSIC